MIALNTIGSARGLIAGDFFDKDGNLSGGREGNIYTQGLENQARISANQTAGVGKLGEFTREQMNAIQYGAQAGALNQIAQGRSLQRVHGTGEAFNQSYDAMAETQADMQNYTAKESARAARAKFGDLAGGHGGASFAASTYSNSRQKFDEMVGSANAYRDETENGKLDTAEKGAYLSNATKLRTTSTERFNAAFNGGDEAIIASRAGDAAEKTLKGVVFHNEKVEQGARLENGAIMPNSSYESGLKAQTKTDTSKDIEITSNAESALQTAANETADKATQHTKDNANSTWTGYQRSAINYAAKVMEAGSYSNLGIATANALHKAATGNSMSEGLKSSALAKEINTQYENIVNSDPTHIRGQEIQQAAASGRYGDLGRLTASQQIDMSAGNVFGSINANSSGGKQGSFQSGVSYSHNESRNYSFGTNVSGGSAIAGAALSMGMSASTYGAISSGVAAAGQVAGAAAMFLPGGAMGKGF